MKATITSKESKFNANHRKENKFYRQYSAIVFSGENASEAVTLRLYGTEKMTYACVWVHANGIWKSGTGSAGGYGYHRGSAAAGEAIENAGIELSERISGVGNTAINKAITAIAKAACGDNAMIYICEAYG